MAEVTARMTEHGRIVYYDAFAGRAVTWREGSETFNVWSMDAVGGKWRNVDAFTHGNVHGPATATAIADEWMTDGGE